MEALRMRALLSAAHCIWRQQCRSHKRDAVVLEFALAETDSFIKNKAAKTGVFAAFL